MPDPIRKGSFRDYSFAKVYYAIAGHGRTGVLDIVDESDELVKKKLFFLGGDSCFVKFGPLGENLGQILLRKGLIDEDQLEEAIDEIALTQRPLGRILEERGWIEPAKLHENLLYQTRLKLVSCFAYTEDSFHFEKESVAQFSHDVPMYKVVPDEIVYQGVMEHYSLDRLEKEFEFIRDKGLRLRAEFEERYGSFHFLPEELEMVRGITEGKPFGLVIGTSNLGLTRTLKVLYALLVTGLLEVAPPKGIKEVKIEEKETVRRQPKTIELPDEPEGPPAESFAAAVTDFLMDEIKKERGGKDRGELIRFDEGKELVVAQVSELLLQHKKEALESYLTARGGAGSAKVGEILVQNKVIESSQLQAAFANMRDKNTSFLNSLVEIGAIKGEDLHDFLASHYKVPAVKLSDLELDQEIVSILPQAFAMKYKTIPINRVGNTLVVAMADPSNIEATDQIKFLTEYNVEVVVATEAEIKDIINRFHDSAEMLDDVMQNFDDSDIENVSMEEDFDLLKTQNDSGTAPVVKLVNQVLLDAIRKHASDIHFEPYENALRVRYRIDGVLYHTLSPPYKLRNALVSRLKIMANMDIAERRLPQDGRISLRVGGKKIDFRVSTLPTLWGEKLVLRILDKESLQLDLTKLGMEQKQLDDLRWALHQPYGMVLVTGPSGCGKTTTLYSSLIELNKITDNISTAEDPVEYYLEGINQVQMADAVGLNFAFTLRAFLRQDPDIIMVGEIRDFETAEIAVKAALTGHVVLSTVHTNDAPSTVNRLLNMGVEPFLITASLNAVGSQRLVRRLCDECKEPEEFERKHLISVGVPEELIEDFSAQKAVGCPACIDRGYKGRLGIYEVMTLRGELAEFVLAGATPSELKREAMRRGMRTMRQVGLTKVQAGLTTLSEITRTTMPDAVGTTTPFEDVN
jgi:type IV pilus assembly protein PilB